MALPDILTRLNWAARVLTHEGMAAEIGVTRATITRYISGIRTIPTVRYQQLMRAYERTVYEQFTARGMSPEQAARYRYGTPQRVDQWFDRLETVVDKFSRGVAIQRAKKLEVPWDELPFNEKERLLREADVTIRESLDASGKGIEDFERY